MADTFKGIITADGKKRQLPYNAVFGTPASDPTLSLEGAFADSKAVGDKFKEAKAETDSLKEDIGNIFPVQPDKTTFFNIEKSTNLLSENSNSFEIGRLKNGEIDKSQTNFVTSPIIDIGDNSGKYIVTKTSTDAKGTNASAFYDVDRKYISGLNYSDNAGVLLIPENARYYRFSTAAALQANYFVGINPENSADIPYEPYYNNIFIKKEYIDKDELEDSWYKGKKAAALGDSITANGSTYYADDGRSGSAWREFVAEELGLADTIYNCGIGGTKVSGDNANAMWQDSRIETIPEDINFLLFNGGMNDWGGNVQLGDENGIDTNTFYGALNVISKKITQKFPTIPIFFMTTTYGYRGDREDGKNSIGLTQYDYGRAIKKVAEKHGFPCIDLHALCGWNRYNISQFVNDESSTEFAGFIHPNRNGGRKMATAICSVVKQYQPCEID